MAKQANVAILIVGEGDEGGVCADEWAGVIRKEDVRATEKEKVIVGEGFRIGDVVRGVVVGGVFVVAHRAEPGLGGYSRLSLTGGLS